MYFLPVASRGFSLLYSSTKPNQRSLFNFFLLLHGRMILFMFRRYIFIITLSTARNDTSLLSNLKHDQNRLLLDMYLFGVISQYLII